MGIGILTSYFQWRVGTWFCSSVANAVYVGIKRRYQGADLQVKSLPNMLNLTRDKVEEIASLVHLKELQFSFPWVHKGTFRYLSAKDFNSAVDRIVDVATGVFAVSAITGLLGKMLIDCAQQPDQLGVCYSEFGEFFMQGRVAATFVLSALAVGRLARMLVFRPLANLFVSDPASAFRLIFIKERFNQIVKTLTSMESKLAGLQGEIQITQEIVDQTDQLACSILRNIPILRTELIHSASLEPNQADGIIIPLEAVCNRLLIIKAGQRITSSCAG